MAIESGKGTSAQWEQIINAMKYGKEKGIDSKLQLIK